MKRRRWNAVGRAWLTLLLCGAAPAPLRGQEPSDARLAARLDTLFAPYASPRSAGCVVGAARGGRTLVERAYGMADLERSVPNDTATIFDAGSISKQFTAAAVLLLAQRDSLSLDDDVRGWLPEVPELSARAITIRDLLHHTSGLREWGVMAALRGWPVGTASYTNADVLDLVAHQQALNFEPGTDFLYSNTNYNLLALLVERVTHRSLAEYTRSAFFQPLQMTHTSWRDDYRRIVPQRALSYAPGSDRSETGDGVAGEAPHTSVSVDDAYGSAGLLTTVGDLLRWNEELEAGQVLGRAVVAQLEQPTVLRSGRRVPYGAGLFLTLHAGQRQLWHAGSAAGYRAFLARLPEKHVSVALLCNWANANPFVIGHVVLDLVSGQPATRGFPEADPMYGGGFRPLLIDRRSPLAGLYRDAGTAEAVRFVPDTVSSPYERRSAVITISSTEFRLATNPGVRLVVRSVPGQRRSRLLWIPMSADTTVLEPVEPFRAEAPLLDYTGEWYSPEVDGGMRIVLEEGRLVAELRPDMRLALTPIYADGFAVRGAVLRFDRNAAGQVTGLGVWAPRARDIRYRRLLP